VAQTTSKTAIWNAIMKRRAAFEITRFGENALKNDCRAKRLARPAARRARIAAGAAFRFPSFAGRPAFMGFTPGSYSLPDKNDFTRRFLARPSAVVVRSEGAWNRP